MKKDPSECCFMCEFWAMRAYCYTGYCNEESQSRTLKGPGQSCGKFNKRRTRYPVVMGS